MRKSRSNTATEKTKGKKIQKNFRKMKWGLIQTENIDLESFERDMQVHKESVF